MSPCSIFSIRSGVMVDVGDFVLEVWLVGGLIVFCGLTGVIGSALRVIWGAFGVIWGALGVIRGAFGVIRGAL